MPAKQPKMTFSALAKEVGTTTSVVSRVMKNTSTTIAISKETKRKILDLAWEQGFRTNNNIGFMTPSEIISVDSIYYPVMTGVMERCSELNYGVFNSTFDDKEPEQIPQFLLERNVSGMIFLTRIPVFLNEFLIAEKIPYVVTNPIFSEMENDSVTFSDYETMNNLLDHLNAMGYRKYVYVSYDAGSNYSNNVLECFHDFIDAKAYEGKIMLPNSSEDTDASMEKIICDLKSEMEKANDETVFITPTRLFTIKILEVAASQGKVYPSHFGFVGNNLLADYSIPKLTTVFYPFYELGKAAVNMIGDKWKHKTFSTKTAVIKGKIIKNQSTNRRLG